jgi:hypothetical protein
MEQLLPPCHRQHQNTCCDDETITHESQDFKPVSSEDHAISGFPLVTIQPPVAIRDVVPSDSIVPNHYLPDHPPLPAPDLVVAYQVFLI